MKKISVLIPDSEVRNAIPVVRSLALKEDIEIHALSSKSNPPISYSTRVKSFRQLKINDQKEIIFDDLVGHIKRTNADILLPIGEQLHRYVSLYHTEIKKYCKTSPVSPLEVINKVTDKWQLALFLADMNIPGPKSVFLNDQIPFEEQLKDICFPLIAKPSKGYGGIGIKKINNISELNVFFRKLSVLNMGNYILQEHIDGYDIDCSLISKDGKVLAYTIQKGFISRSNKFAASAGIQFLKNEKLYDNIETFIKAINYSGIAHVDLRYDNKDGSYKILDVNARFWGSLTGSQIVDVNFPYLTVLAGLGIEFSIPEYKLGRYIDHTTAAKRMIEELFSNRKDKIKYSETDFKYIFKDPLSEIINIMEGFRGKSIFNISNRKKLKTD